jgi:hypothetical protein
MVRGCLKSRKKIENANFLFARARQIRDFLDSPMHQFRLQPQSRY